MDKKPAASLMSRRARWGLLSVLWRALGSRAVVANGGRAQLAWDKLLRHAAKTALIVAAGYSLLGLTVGNMPRAMHAFGEIGALALILLAAAAAAGVVYLQARRCRASCPAKFPCPQCSKEMDARDGLAGFAGQFFELRACPSCGALADAKGEKAALPAAAVRGPWSLAAAATFASAFGGFIAAGLFWNSVGARRLADLRGQAERAGYTTELPKARPKPRDEDNAAFFFAKAAKDHQDVKKEPSFYKGKSEDEFPALFLANALRGAVSAQEITLARKLVEKRRDLLAQLEMGASKTEDHWGIDWDIRPTFNINIPKYGGLLALSRLLACRAVLSSMDGRTAAALADVQLGLKLARSVGSEPMLIARMVEFVLTGAAMDAAAVVARRASLSQASEALTPFLSDTRLVEHFKESLGLEQFAMADWFGELTWPGAFRLNEDAGLGGLWMYWPFLKLDLASHTEYSLAANRALAEPYSRSREAGEKAYEDFKRSGWTFAQIAAPPSWRNYQAKAFVQAANHRLALTAIAVRSFKEKNGRWPDALWEISPSAKTPLMLEDPFTGGPFKILRVKDGVLVYSVGPDEVDDQGAPYEASEMRGDVGWRI